MQERDIMPTDVVNCIDNGKIIEQYPEAYPYPACLILGKTENKKLIHIVAGYGNEFAWIVTAYEPDAYEWIDGFMARRR